MSTQPTFPQNTRSGPAAGGLARIQALDGLRTVSVFAVVFFHLAFPGMAAGYLGVDIFFVLSGYLITSKLAGEIIASGRISLLRFWARRAQRLLPAAVLLLACVALYAWLVARPFRRPDLGGDLVATTLYYANWHFIDAGLYFATEPMASPLHHMWSLSLEEQFYLLWPLALLGVVAAGRLLGVRRERLLPVATAVCLVLICASFAAMQWQVRHPERPDRPYMGTDAKAFEPLLGALLALLLSEPLAHRLLVRAARWLGWLGVVGAAGLFLLMGRSRSYYYNGGAVLFCGAIGAVILALVWVPGFLPGRILAWRPLAYLGRISYGIYLWHWPWALMLDCTRAFSPVRALIAIVGTIVTASLSYHLMEARILAGRVRGWRGSLRTFLTALTAMLVVLVASAPLGGSVVSPLAAALRPTPAQNPQTVMMVGDSVPYHLLPALDRAGQAQGLTIVNATMRGCSPLGVAIKSSPTDVLGGKCVGASRKQQQRIEETNPGLVIWWSRYESADRYRDGVLLTPEDDGFWDAQREDLRVSLDRLTARGATVVVVLTERPGLGIRKACTETSCHPMHRRMIDHGEWRERWNAIVSQETQHNPKLRTITVEDQLCPGMNPATTGVDRWLCNDVRPRTPDGTAPELRPDGTHVNLNGVADDVAVVVLSRAKQAAA